MTEWTNQLVAEDRMDDLFKCYDQACEILPACESVLNNIGAQLFRYPLEIKSWGHTGPPASFLYNIVPMAMIFV
jgi:hypothetical protein